MARFSMQLNEELEKALAEQMDGLGISKVQAINAILDAALISGKLQGENGEPGKETVRNELAALNRILGKG